MPLPRTAVIVTACGLPLVLAGCSSPGRPSTSLVASRPTSPSNGSAFSYYSQPVTLLIANGVATGGTLTNIVEVATDATFTTVITTQAVSPDAGGRLAITLDHLSPATTYYWRVKTSAGDNPGTVSAPQSFTIGPLLVIQPPTPVQPLADTFPHKRPTFIVKNATHTGPPATPTYQFDVAADKSFASVVTNGTVPEASAQTSFVPVVDLTPGVTYYWRVRALDAATGVKSDFAVQNFSVVPDDGKYRYRLELFVPDDCHGSWSFFIYPALSLNPIAFDDALTIQGDALKFAPRVCGDRTWDNLPPFTLELKRNSAAVVGTIGGTTYFPTVGCANALIVQAGSRVVGLGEVLGTAGTAGVANNEGSFEGTFDGAVSAFDTYDTYRMCSSKAVRWRLTPWTP
jgi:hypothetical protein